MLVLGVYYATKSLFRREGVLCIEHLLGARHRMLSQYLLNEWLPLNISQPTWKREGSCSYCTEEKTAAQRGWAVLPGSWPHSSHYSPAGCKEAEGPSWARDSRQQHCGRVALSGVLADLGASRPDRGIGWDLAIRCRWRCAWRAGCPCGFSFPPQRRLRGEPGACLSWAPSTPPSAVRTERRPQARRPETDLLAQAPLSLKSH